MNRAALKEKLASELGAYLINFVYLALFFGVFIGYKRLLLAQYDIGYENYGISLIKALILAKVIMIGDLLRLGRKADTHPLIVRTLHKTVVFTLWVVLFRGVEIVVISFIHGTGFAGAVHEIAHRSPYEMLAHGLIVFVAFLPFFSLRELSAVIGRRKVWELFFSRPGEHKL
ncbi:MAG: hypothetical protein N839_0005060 [Desulfofustis sp. PB-SRB1]|jgi:hypothetical protein|nr:hypothetical protein [Desulfofustis sp. PB-SRB1]HBH32343.1 hypothetical protein [Desulfofustis sp.]